MLRPQQAPGYSVGIGCLALSADHDDHDALWFDDGSSRARSERAWRFDAGPDRAVSGQSSDPCWHGHVSVGWHLRVGRWHLDSDVVLGRARTPSGTRAYARGPWLSPDLKRRSTVTPRASSGCAAPRDPRPRLNPAATFAIPRGTPRSHSGCVTESLSV